MFASTNSGAYAVERSRGIWIGFKHTAGLEKFTIHNRYGIWLSQHQKLLNEDPRYAVANARFQMQAAAVWVFALFTFFNVTFAASGEVALLFSVIGAAALGWLVFRGEQERRNEAIGQSLEPSR